MAKSSKKIDRIKETFLIPADVDRVLEELPARIMLDSGVKITKTDIIVELLKLLQIGKINTKHVNSIDDVFSQVKKFIKMGD